MKTRFPPNPLREEWKSRASAVPMADLVARLPELRNLRGRVEMCGPCPRCGGIDRFSVNTRKNLFNCRGCDARGGDAIALLRHCRADLTFSAACEFLTGDPPPDRPSNLPAHDRAAAEARARELRERAAALKAEREAALRAHGAREIARAREIWASARPVTSPDEPVAVYLERARRLPGLWKSAAVRAAVLPYWVSRRGERPQVLFTGPAMVCAVTDAAGDVVAVHITWVANSPADLRIGRDFAALTSLPGNAGKDSVFAHGSFATLNASAGASLPGDAAFPGAGGGEGRRAPGGIGLARTNGEVNADPGSGEGACAEAGKRDCAPGGQPAPAEPPATLAGVSEIRIKKARPHVIDPETGRPFKMKKMRGMPFNAAGGAGCIRLAPARPFMVFGEGVETTGAVIKALRAGGADVSGWAGLSLDGLSRMPLPEHTQTALFLGDGDSDPEATRAKIGAACERARALGIPNVLRVFAPPGTDFGDMIESSSGDAACSSPPVRDRGRKTGSHFCSITDGPEPVGEAGSGEESVPGGIGLARTEGA